LKRLENKMFHKILTLRFLMKQFTSSRFYPPKSNLVQFDWGF